MRRLRLRERIKAWAMSRRRPVGDGRGDVFFWRWKILKTPIISIFVHEFVRSDKDRCLHDHPWPFVAILLRDGYIEQRGFKEGGYFTSWQPAGSILFRKASDSHRIEIKPGTKPLSLVIVGPKIRDWGFYTIYGWRKWVEGQPNPICATDDPRAEEYYLSAEPASGALAGPR